MKNIKNFEDSLKRLETITKEMEKNEMPLDNALELYKEGIDEALFCAKFLKSIEQEVFLLQKNADGLFELNSFYDMEEY